MSNCPFPLAVVAAAIVLGAALPLPGIAQEKPPEGRIVQKVKIADPGEMVRRLTQSLNLTPEQQKRASPVLEQMFAQIRAVAQSRSAKPEDRAAKVKAIRGASFAKLKPILTPEQHRRLEGMIRFQIRPAGAPGTVKVIKKGA